MALKKIVVKNTSLDDDEHTYYAIIFIQPDITMNKRLRFSSSSGKLEATYTFTESPLSEGEKFLVILAAVEESEEIDAEESRILAKSPSNTDIVEFDFHP
jgi:hypothetical protein